MQRVVNPNEVSDTGLCATPGLVFSKRVDEMNLLAGDLWGTGRTSPPGARK
jgi:hypothetical protein